MTEKNELINITESKRLAALTKYHVIQPYLEKDLTLNEIHSKTNVSIRTLRLWISKFRSDGLIGLVAKERSD